MPTYPELDYDLWLVTREALQIYAKLFGAIRRELSPPESHWQHITLHVNEQGLITPNIPAPNSEAKTFTLTLDLVAHEAIITPAEGRSYHFSLKNQRPRSFTDLIISTLQRMDVDVEVNREAFDDNDVYTYNPYRAEDYRQAITHINAVMADFKAGLSGETTNLQLFPHHFDLAFSWFSGQEAEVAEGEEGGSEQMTFGFSPGFEDDLEEAYFYITAWPEPEGYVGADGILPAEANWHTAGWRGAILRYEVMRQADDPEAMLTEFLQAAYQHGSGLMLN